MHLRKFNKNERLLETMEDGNERLVKMMEDRNERLVKMMEDRKGAFCCKE